MFGRAPREALGQVRGPLAILLQEILYNRSRPEKFQATGVEIERQKRRGRRPTAMCRSEGRVAKKLFRTISTWNHIQPSPITTCARVPPRLFSATSLRNIYNRRPYAISGGWSGYWRFYGRPAPLPRQGVPGANSLSLKPSRLAGAISADVRSAERACRSELLMRERRLRSESVSYTHLTLPTTPYV